ncbi:MAG: HAD family hydrolase [Lachnospiraceae bacterium]|nr:HAD family hydrolase [Lachnospiraceae bacterium]
MMYQNYIFDLYGTLIDIHTDEYSKNFYKKYAKWLRKQGYFFEWKLFYRLYTSLEKQYRDNAMQEGRQIKPEICVDDVFRDVFEIKGYKVSDEEILHLCENFRRISLIYMCLFPDTITCLDGLKKAGKKIYLLSNAQRSFTWTELEQTGLVPYFDGILISSDEGCMKPDPEFYNICCERYGLDKSQSVMIGNELKSDMAGAKAAGIDGFYINRAPVFHKDAAPVYRYVSENGSLMEVLTQTGID